MNSYLIHGIYESQTLATLKELGINEFSFDLRGRSPNLIPFYELQSLLTKLPVVNRIFVTFENDKKETILSFLNMLEKSRVKIFLMFRDQQNPAFYQGLNQSFYWMFNPHCDWKSILSLDLAHGVLLPLKYQEMYRSLPELWKMIEKKNLDVYLHADNFEQGLFVTPSQDMKLSIDLTSEVEKSFRLVDQEKLRQMKLWRKLNENSARQR